MPNPGSPKPKTGPAEPKAKPGFKIEFASHPDDVKFDKMDTVLDYKGLCAPISPVGR